MRDALPLLKSIETQPGESVQSIAIRLAPFALVSIDEFLAYGLDLPHRKLPSLPAKPNALERLAIIDGFDPADTRVRRIEPTGKGYLIFKREVPSDWLSPNIQARTGLQRHQFDKLTSNRIRQSLEYRCQLNFVSHCAHHRCADFAPFLSRLGRFSWFPRHNRILHRRLTPRCRALRFTLANTIVATSNRCRPARIAPTEEGSHYTTTDDFRS
jgi:hypothetical protein